MSRSLRAVMAVALAARVAVLAAAAMGVFLIGEGRVQRDLAQNIMEGRGLMLSPEMLHPPGEAEASPMFRSTFEFYRDVDGYYGALRPGRPTTFLVPGYALFMAGVFSVLGRSYLAVRGVQLLLGLLTVLLGYRLASRFLRGGWLTAAGLAMALNPFELYYEAIPATQALFTLLLTASLLMTVIMLSGRGPLRSLPLSALLTGACWGVAFLVRPAALPLAAWGMLLLPFSGSVSKLRFGLRPNEGHRFGRGLSAGLLAFAAFAAVLMPWGLRNRAVTGELRFLPTQGGVQLWEYNGRIFTSHFEHELQGARLLYGRLREQYMGQLDSPELAEFPDFEEEPEWVRDSVLYSRNIRFMRANPVLTLRLMSLRFVELFKPFPLNAFSPGYTLAGLLFFFPVLLFLWGGALLILREGAGGVYLSTAVAGYCLMHILTAAGTPHRVSIDFPMVIMAVYGLRHAVARLAASRRRRA